MLKSATRKTNRSTKSTPKIGSTKLTTSHSFPMPASSSASNPTLDYLRSQKDLLRQLKENRTKNIEDLANLLALISDGFPETDKSIIHYQDTEEFALFSSEVVDAIASKYDARSDRYSTYSFTKGKNNQCIEANILQYVARLRIPMSETVHKRSKYPAPFADVMTELLNRTAKYFNDPRSNSQINHLTFTLAALTNIDINQFKTEYKARSFFENDSVSFGSIDSLVRVAISHIDHNLGKWQPDALIRALHSIIILKQSDAKFQDFLSSDFAKTILEQVAKNISGLNPSTPKDVHLAQQLFQIRNIFPDVFPASLSSMIKPFTSIFSASSHGSGFETAVFRTLKQAARELSATYGPLINERRFNPSNPISEALGLESDIAYENGYIKACIQVDGDKYHTYNGSKNTTQKTLLRDFCFSQDGWEVINFTDATNDKESAKQFIIDKIIIPTYEAKTKSNLQNVAQFGKTKETLDAIFSHVEKNEEKMSSLFKIIEQTKSSIYYASPYQDKLSELTNHCVNLEKLMESSQEAIRTLKTLEHQVGEFDTLSAIELSNISNHLKMVNDEINSQTKQIKSHERTNIRLSSELEENVILLEKSSSENDGIQKQIQALRVQQKSILIRKEEVRAMSEALDKFTSNTDTKKVRPEGLPKRPEIKEMKENVDSDLSAVERDISNLERQAVQGKSMALKLMESQKLLQKKQSRLQSEIKILEDAQKSNFEKKSRYEAALSSPVIGATMMNNFANLQKFIEQSNGLVEAFSNIDSLLKSARILHGNVEQENLEAQMSQQTLSEENEQPDEVGNGCVYYPTSVSAPAPREEHGCVYYSPAPQVSYEQYMAYQHYLYQQQVAYQRQLAWEQQQRMLAQQSQRVATQPVIYPHHDKENPHSSYYGYGAPTTSYVPGYQAKAKSYASYTPVASTQPEPSDRNTGERVVTKI